MRRASALRGEATERAFRAHPDDECGDKPHRRQGLCFDASFSTWRTLIEFASRGLMASGATRISSHLGFDDSRASDELEEPVKIGAPVSPSTPLSTSPFMNQTMASFLPSLVVEIGAGGPAAPPIGTHQSTCGRGGAPGGIATDITTRPPALAPAGHCAAASIDIATWTR